MSSVCTNYLPYLLTLLTYVNIKKADVVVAFDELDLCQYPDIPYPMQSPLAVLPTLPMFRTDRYAPLKLTSTFADIIRNLFRSPLTGLLVRGICNSSTMLGENPDAGKVALHPSQSSSMHGHLHSRRNHDKS